MNTRSKVLLVAALLSTGAAVFAATGHDQHVAAAPAADAAAATALTAGEVRKVDLQQGKVTIRHETIANLDMPPMTMVFRAGKPEQLKDLKAGDKIRFRAESQAGTLVATHIEAAK